MSSNPADEYAARMKREQEENPVSIPPDSLDPNVVAALPRNSKTKGGSAGRRMMEGSYYSEAAYHKFSPDHVPRPVAFGELRTEPDTWFYLCEFHDMIDGELPDAQTFVSIVAKVHKDSMGKSPTGQYGFPVATHLADVPTENTWQDSWEAWYLQAITQMYEFENKTQGTDDEEFAAIFKDLCEKVIPRLLRPLETGGRCIQPCLIHSDLWPGNCMPDADSGELIIFDSCAFWGHNEADLGTWRAARYRFGRPFFKEYQKLMGVSEPYADWDDRNALYAVRYDLLLSGLYANDTRFQQMAKNEMKRLVDKHPDGLEGYAE